MADIRNSYSRYVRFILTNYSDKSLEIEKPIGWNDNGLDASRNLKYHGTLTEVTGDLQFIGEAKEYILNSYRKNGVIGKVGLIRLTLRDTGDDVKWVRDFIINADFNTISIKRNVLKVKFNSNNLMDLIDAHEGDEFELDILKSVDNTKIEPLHTNNVEIKGRSLLEVGNSNFVTKKNDLDFQIPYEIHNYNSSDFLGINGNLRYHRYIQTPTTGKKTEGSERFSTVDTLNDTTSGTGKNQLGHKTTASSMFFVNDIKESKGLSKLEITIKLEILLSAKALSFHHGSLDNLTFDVYLRIGSRKDNSTDEKANTDNSFYLGEEIEDIVYSTPLEAISKTIKIQKTINVSVKHNQGVLMQIYGSGFSDYGKSRTGKQQAFSYSIKSGGITCSEIAYFEPSPNLNFIFIHDVFARLMNIITGNTKSYLSSYFGRKEIGYKDNGFGSHIGFISGFWVRAFDESDDKYKAPKISLKDCMTSCINVFNLGAGIETDNFGERLIIEDIDFFYRDEVVIKFPNVISDSEYIIDAKNFFSSLEFGYKKSIKEDIQMGLDEPNKKTLYTTPINNSSKKLKRLSKIRADEYMMEKLRRKTYSKYPNESIDGDEDNWFLDLKKVNVSSYDDIEHQDIIETQYDLYAQKNWNDRLNELPTGIHSPETFRSMLFTPLRILIRNSNLFNSGLYYYRDKFLNYASSSSNKTLSTKFEGEEKARQENSNIPISGLKTPIFRNERVKFKHAMTYELNDLLHAKTSVVINGKNRLIPNYYFKFEWTNEEGKIERGYFLRVKNGNLAEFEFQLSNESII